MAAALMDDVFDVLEGTLAEVIRTRRLVEKDEHVILEMRVREARASVAMLTALMREGKVWRPAVDGSEPVDWRSTLLATCEEVGASASYTTLLRRELDELVTLTPAGARRPLPSGVFERLARRAGVRRDACISWGRAAGDDLVAGWRACDDARSVVRIVLELGISPDEVVAAACRAMRVVMPDIESGMRDVDRARLWQKSPKESERVAGYLFDLIARNAITPLRAEWACEHVQRIGLLRELAEELATPQMRERLAGEGGN